MSLNRPFLAPRLALAAVLLLLMSVCTTSAADPLQQRITTTLREQGLTGAVWATVAAEGRVATGAAGIRNARSGEALRADDRVQVGSIAKPLLALGLLRLVSQGRLSLDAPLAALLPDLAIQNPWAATDPLRLRHLLDHSAGLDDTRLSQLLSLRAGPDTPLAEAFTGRSPDLLRLRSRPGSRMSYSNMGYTLAGMVIEAVTGQRYEAYLDEQLLRPLGLTDSSFRFLSQEGPQADARLAMGHFEGGATQAAVPSFLRPAGQFNTTAADMGRLARFLLAGDGLVQGQIFITPELLRQMGRPMGTEAARAGLAVGYALGLYTRDRHGAVGLCHGGSTIGFRAMLCMYPKEGKAFFMAINTDSESADPAALDKLLLPALQLGQGPAPQATGPGLDSGHSSAWEGWYVPAPNRLASLAWVDTLFGFARLRRDAAGALHFEPLQSPGQLLSPFDGGQLYRAPGRLTASHALLRGADGAHVISTGAQSYEKVSLAAPAAAPVGQPRPGPAGPVAAADRRPAAPAPAAERAAGLEPSGPAAQRGPAGPAPAARAAVPAPIGPAVGRPDPRQRPARGAHGRPAPGPAGGAVAAWARQGGQGYAGPARCPGHAGAAAAVRGAGGLGADAAALVGLAANARAVAAAPPEST